MADKEIIDVNAHYHIHSIPPVGQLLINKHDVTLPNSIRSSLEEIAFLTPMAQGVVIDIGANIGAHTICFSRTAQRVYSFEPQPHSYRVLCANLVLNGVTNVVTYPYGAGGSEWQTTILPIDPTKDHTSQGARIAGYGEQVEIKPLDNFEIVPDFIKIDVEGMEYQVLYGSQNTLLKHSPIVYVEIHNPLAVPKICEYMRKLGYLGDERIVQYTGNHEILTHGYVFYKEGRIVWQ